MFFRAVGQHCFFLTHADPNNCFDTRPMTTQPFFCYFCTVSFLTKIFGSAMCRDLNSLGRHSTLSPIHDLTYKKKHWLGISAFFFSWLANETRQVTPAKKFSSTWGASCWTPHRAFSRKKRVKDFSPTRLEKSLAGGMKIAPAEKINEVIGCDIFWPRQFLWLIFSLLFYVFFTFLRPFTRYQLSKPT